MAKIIFAICISCIFLQCAKYKELDYVDFNNNPSPSILYATYGIQSDTVTNKKNDKIVVCFTAHSGIKSYRIKINDSLVKLLEYDNTNQFFSESYYVNLNFNNRGDSAIVTFELIDFNNKKVYDSLKVYYFDGSISGDKVKAWFSVENKTCNLGEATVFKNNSANNPTHYYWDFGDNTYSTELNPIHTYLMPGEYAVMLIASSFNEKDTIIFEHAVKVVDGLIRESDIDNNLYRCTQIGNQIWTSQDLKTSKYQNSSVIQGKMYPYLMYSFLPNRGYIYNWNGLLNNTNTDIYSICPQGYHVPNINEWETLFAEVGGTQIAGKKLKAPYPYWSYEEYSGDNSSDFDAIASGNENSDFTTKGYYWTATETSVDSAFAIVFDYSDSVSIIKVPKSKYVSVRCIKN